VLVSLRSYADDWLVGDAASCFQLRRISNMMILSVDHLVSKNTSSTILSLGFIVLNLRRSVRQSSDG